MVRTDTRYYAAIDLKSFYASAECVERGLDPLTTNLVVADAIRTEKTICLAVSPSLKAYGIPGRARLFEVIQKVEEANTLRRMKAPGHTFRGSSFYAEELDVDPSLSIDYIIARPQMSHYMEHSAKIYEVYLRYVAPEDIHVYSIDEVFMDITPYLKSSGLCPRDFVRRIIQDVLEESGITATAGIGTNLYLCKVAMDIVAKKCLPDAYGVRIAQLDEMKYRRLLWEHQPLTDFWRIGHGYARKLEKVGLRTMGDIARCSLGHPNEYHNEDLLYKLFGINAELLIDHAWGYEPCTMAHIKAYRPGSSSQSNGQVLSCPYTAEKARLIVREMTDLLVLDLVDKGLVTDQLVLSVGYDRESLTDSKICLQYQGRIATDHYGRKVPQHAHGSVNLHRPNSSTTLIVEAMMELYDRIVDKNLLVRRLNVTANHLMREGDTAADGGFEQLDLFSDAEARHQRLEAENAALAREKRRQKAVLTIQKKYGKNALLKGMNLEKGATARERNNQIGGHRA